MPGASRTFPFGPGAVTLGADGAVESVVAKPGGLEYLVGGGRVSVTVAGRDVVWSSPTVTVDVDEMEIRTASDGAMELTVRHVFAVGWGVRVVLANASDQSVDLVVARMSWVPSPYWPVWVLAAGATAGYAVLPGDGNGLVLGGELTRGAVIGMDEQGWDVGTLRLAPFGRYVLSWQWDWYQSPAGFERGRFVAVPRELVLGAGETARITVGDDEAVVARGGVDQIRVGAELELSPLGSPQQVQLSVSSARGVTAYELTFVSPAEEVLFDLGASALPGPLRSVDAAVAVQRLLARAEADDPRAATDALDRFTGRLLDAVSGYGPREISYLCAEFERTGEIEVLDTATAGLLGLAAPLPGVGLAATHLCVARMVADRPVEEVLDHLGGLAVLPVSELELVDLAVRLELLAVGPVRGTSVGRSVWSEVDALLDRIGARLGAGLRGRPIRPLPVDDLAHLAVVLGLLPEQVGAPIRGGWGMSPHALARKTEAEVIARLAGEPPRAAYGWLVLGQRLR